MTAAGGWPSTTNGCADAQKVEYGTNDIDMYLMDFDPTTDEFAQWNWVMPSDYDGGQVFATPYWTSATGSTGTVIWGVQGRCWSDGEAIDQAWGGAKEVTDINTGANNLNIAPETAAITLSGTPAANEEISIRVYRDATTDTHVNDARLKHVVLRFSRS